MVPGGICQGHLHEQVPFGVGWSGAVVVGATGVGAMFVHAVITSGCSFVCCLFAAVSRAARHLPDVSVP